MSRTGSSSERGPRQRSFTSGFVSGAVLVLLVMILVKVLT